MDMRFRGIGGKMNKRDMRKKGEDKEKVDQVGKRRKRKKKSSDQVLRISYQKGLNFGVFK